MPQKAVRSRKAVLTAFAVLLISWLIPGEAQATSIRIDDITDTIVISWTGFRDSVYIGGQQSLPDGSVQLTEAVDPVTGFPKEFAFSGFFDSPGGDHWTQNKNTVIYFSEAGGGISDVLQLGFDVRGNVTLVSGVFSSDVDGSPLWTESYLLSRYGPADLTIAEAADLEVVGYLKTPLPPGFTSLIVNSDVEAAAVPEPATLTLLGLGLSGLGVRMRRRRT